MPSRFIRHEKAARLHVLKHFYIGWDRNDPYLFLFIESPMLIPASALNKCIVYLFEMFGSPLIHKPLSNVGFDVPNVIAKLIVDFFILV